MRRKFIMCQLYHKSGESQSLVDKRDVREFQTEKRIRVIQFSEEPVAFDILEANEYYQFIAKWLVCYNCGVFGTIYIVDVKTALKFV
jgi:hypothetical protein